MTEQAIENPLGKERIGKLLLKLSLPAITAQVINALYNIVDRMYIGNIPEIGKSALTGVGVAFPLIIIITAFSALVGMGGAPLAAIKMGEKDDQGAEKILGNCVTLLLGIGIVLTIVFSKMCIRDRDCGAGCPSLYHPDQGSRSRESKCG